MKKGIWFLLPLALCLSLTAGAFADVPAGHWAEDTIARAAEAGVVSGYADGSFRPEAPVTGGQFCAMLARSFRPDAYEAARAEAAEPWWLPGVTACAGLLDGTAMGDAYAASGQWDGAVDEPLSRYDMAQMLSALAQDLPSPEQAEAVLSALTDGGTVPQRYRTAVAACYDLGLLQGLSDGSFGGGSVLNRAQACAVWWRLRELLDSRESGVPPLHGQEEEEGDPLPLFGLRGDETAQQMMDRINQTTPRFQDGVLSNGKPISQENIQELLDQVRETCPDRTLWNKNTRYDYRCPKAGVSSADLSFGLCVSDFLFGEDAPVTQHQDFRRLKAGDVVAIQILSTRRTLVIIGVDGDQYTACEMTEDHGADWSESGRLGDFIQAPGTWIYTRY